MNIQFTMNEKSREGVIRKLIRSKLPIVVYGTGKFARFAAELLLKYDLQICYFLDEDKYWYPDKEICMGGVIIPCIRQSDLAKVKAKFNMVSGMIDYRKQELLRNQFPDCEVIEYLDAVDSHIIQRSFLDTYSVVLDEIYEELCDDESKKVMKAFLYARYSGDVSELCRLVYDKYMYDWELLNLTGDDIVIDGGAYTGDTVLEIKKFLNGRMPKYIYAFEPDEKNREQLNMEIEREHLANVFVEPAGLLDRDGKLYFTGSGTLGASFNENGETAVDTIAIDNHEKYSGATIIKMDVEGCELQALEGCKELLKKRPRLAICIYHKNEDVISIYQFLKPYGYKFFLRQHSYSAEETVMYAIAKLPVQEK